MFTTTSVPLVTMSLGWNLIYLKRSIPPRQPTSADYWTKIGILILIVLISVSIFYARSFISLLWLIGIGAILLLILSTLLMSIFKVESMDA